MRLLVVSNRLPVTVYKKKHEYQTTQSIGGLTSALSVYTQEFKSKMIWLGWPGVEVPSGNKTIVKKLLRSRGMYEPLFLSKSKISQYYDGFCNRTLWPLFHYNLDSVELQDSYWNTYQAVNKLYAEEIVQLYKPNDIILIQDYHLMLAPRLVRDQLPDAAIGFFLHIPFPAYEIFRILPSEWRKTILSGVLGADAIGFHTEDYTHYFLDNVRHILNIEPMFQKLPVNNRTVMVNTFPLGIDVSLFQSRQTLPTVTKAQRRWRKLFGSEKIILSIDRLDYTKGILNRLQGFQHFLEHNPTYRGNVTMVVVVVPSRISIKEYRQMKRNIDELVGEINGSYGTMDWTPVIYHYRAYKPGPLSALYGIADIALVTPLRDGMNLIAKEYIASKISGKGVLILSEFAGASKELSEAVIINPHSVDEISTAIKQAVEMPTDEQVTRNKILQDRLRQFDIHWWSRSFLANLQEIRKQRIIPAKQLQTHDINHIRRNFERAQKRLLMLDYDGTLVPFAPTPIKATPSKKMLSIISEITRDSATQVAIISGRNRTELEQWFGKLNLTLVAEHGVFIKFPNSEWFRSGEISNSWKSSITSVLQRYVQQVPMSFIEDKEYSLAWHYRQSNSLSAGQAAYDLRDELIHLTTNANLQVIMGNKVIEVKNASINKGTASLWMSKRKQYDFIMAVGDDVTDEDMFTTLPNDAYTIKVGKSTSKARYYVQSPRSVIHLLHQFNRKNKPTSQLITTQVLTNEFQR